MRMNRVIHGSPLVRHGFQRVGFTMLELLVVLSILGVLLALLLPAVQQARESARAAQCKNNLHQMGLALHNFESALQTLPAGNDFAHGYDHSWCGRILPFLEQHALSARYDWNQSWNSNAGTPGGTNRDVTSTSIPLFQCPSESAVREGGIDYGGNSGTSKTGLPAGYNEGDGWSAGSMVSLNAFGPRPVLQPTRMSDFTDGLSQTFLVYECSGRTTDSGFWGSGTNCLGLEYPVNGNPDGETIMSRHASGGFVLYADGHVSLIATQTDFLVAVRLATRNGNEITKSFDSMF